MVEESSQMEPHDELRGLVLKLRGGLRSPYNPPGVTSCVGTGLWKQNIAPNGITNPLTGDILPGPVRKGPIWVYRHVKPHHTMFRRNGGSGGKPLGFICITSSLNLSNNIVNVIIKECFKKSLISYNCFRNFSVFYIVVRLSLNVYLIYRVISGYVSLSIIIVKKILKRKLDY